MYAHICTYIEFSTYIHDRCWANDLLIAQQQSVSQLRKLFATTRILASKTKLVVLGGLSSATCLRVLQATALQLRCNCARGKLLRRDKNTNNTRHVECGLERDRQSSASPSYAAPTPPPPITYCKLCCYSCSGQSVFIAKLFVIFYAIIIITFHIVVDYLPLSFC